MHFKVVPGETALAFYTAKNPTDKPVIGISTYNVIPFEAGQYFNKIQCFCFEEQQLNPHEEVIIIRYIFSVKICCHKKTVISLAFIAKCAQNVQ